MRPIFSKYTLKRLVEFGFINVKRTLKCTRHPSLYLLRPQRQLTFATRTPAPPRKQLSRTSALARVGYGGVYPGRGQMLSTSSDDRGAYSHSPLNM